MGVLRKLDISVTVAVKQTVQNQLNNLVNVPWGRRKSQTPYVPHEAFILPECRNGFLWHLAPQTRHERSLLSTAFTAERKEAFYV